MLMRGLFRLRTSRLALVAFVLMLLVCAQAVRADTWVPGQLNVYDEGAWGDEVSPSAAATLLLTHYDIVYASTFGVFEVGSPSGFTMYFTKAATLVEYLPASGIPGVLDASLVDPTSSSAGVFGGDVAALKLNVDFSDAGLLPGSADIPFGNLILRNLNSSFAALDELTVRQVLGDADACLGGSSCIIDVGDFEAVVANLNASFSNGYPDSFAEDFLVAPGGSSGGGSGPPSVPEPMSVLLLGVGLLTLGTVHHKRRGGDAAHR